METLVTVIGYRVLFTAITRQTEGLNVINAIRSTKSNRYNVINSQLSIRLTTQTNIAVIVAKVLPLLRGISTYRAFQAVLTAMITCSFGIGVLSAPSLANLSHLFRIGVIPSLAELKFLSAVFLFTDPSVSVLFGFFGTGLPPSLAILIALFLVFLLGVAPAFLIAIWMTLDVPPISLMLNLGISRMEFSRSVVFAFFANAIQPILTACAFIKLRFVFIGIAFTAPLSHSASLMCEPLTVLYHNGATVFANGGGLWKR